jgi:septal ring factor EnvC (AmiA/AmiB activator)
VIPPSDTPIPERRKLSRVQVLEATAAAVLASAIASTTGGVAWLVVQLPSRLQQMESSIERILNNQEKFENKFSGLEEKVQDHDRRIIRLELRR